MDPAVASMLAALTQAGQTGSTAAVPSSIWGALPPATQAALAPLTNNVSWDVPSGGPPSPYMPAQHATGIAPPAAPPAPMPMPMPDAAMPAAAPPLAGGPVLAASAPDVPQPPPTPPVDPGTMPGSLGAGALAQPDAPLTGGIAPSGAIPDMYAALFGRGGAAPAAGYGMGNF